MKIPGLPSSKIKIAIADRWRLEPARLDKVEPHRMKEAIKNLFMKDGLFLQRAVSGALGDEAEIGSIGRIEARYFQEGLKTAVFQVMAKLKDGRKTTFCLSVSEYPNDEEYDIFGEFDQISFSWSRHPEDIPEPYAKGAGMFHHNMSEPTELKMIAVEWIKDSVELDYFVDRNTEKWKFYLNYYSGYVERATPVFAEHYLSEADGRVIAEEMVRILAKDYDPATKSMVDSLDINAGDFVIRMLNKEGDFDLKLVTIRKRRYGVGVSDLIERLLKYEVDYQLIDPYTHKHITLLKYKKPFRPPHVVFRGIQKGLMDLHGENKGRELTRQWLERYKKDKHKFARQVDRFLETGTNEPLQARLANRYARMLTQGLIH
ncbi:MAG: hypothetical protein J7J91_11185 [Deltaproteobacteria bacterium]|nr:hypothetical protein [Deltaproteobacteria bacterium]